MDHSYSCKGCGEKIPIDEDFNLETPNYLFPLCVDCCGDIEEEIRGIVDRQVTLKQDAVSEVSAQ